MVEENKVLQAKTLGFLHLCDQEQSKSSSFPNSDGWSDDEMANILFACMLRYQESNDVAITFSNQDPEGTIVIVINKDTVDQKFFSFDVHGARHRVASILEKSKVLVERRNNAVGATPPGEGKD